MDRPDIDFAPGDAQSLHVSRLIPVSALFVCLHVHGIHAHDPLSRYRIRKSTLKDTTDGSAPNLLETIIHLIFTSDSTPFRIRGAACRSQIAPSRDNESLFEAFWTVAAHTFIFDELEFEEIFRWSFRTAAHRPAYGTKINHANSLFA